MINDLEKQLKRIKNSETAGACREDWVSVNRDALMSEIGDNQAKQVSSFAWVFVLSSWFGAMAVRPVAVVILVFFVITSGWITSVNASRDSLPGELLYSVKIATERAQLGFAIGEQKTKLHVEFAGRRLGEVATLIKTGNPENDSLIAATVESFDREMAIVEKQINDYKESNKVDEVAELAQIVNQKTEEYSQVISDSRVEFADEGDETVEGALATIESIDDNVMTMLVETHEVNANAKSEEAVKINFTDDLRLINHKTVSLLGRLSLLEKVSNEKNIELSLDTDDLIDEVNDLDNPLQEASDLIGHGGYNTAIYKLQEVKTGLRVIETNIVELEIEVSTFILEKQKLEEKRLEQEKDNVIDDDNFIDSSGGGEEAPTDQEEESDS